MVRTDACRGGAGRGERSDRMELPGLDGSAGWIVAAGMRTPADLLPIVGFEGAGATGVGDGGRRRFAAVDGGWLLAGTWLNWMEETLLSEMEDGRRRSLAGMDGEMALARGRDARWPRGIVAGAAWCVKMRMGDAMGWKVLAKFGESVDITLLASSGCLQFWGDGAMEEAVVHLLQMARRPDLGGGADRALLAVDGLLSPARWAKGATLLMGQSWPSSSPLPADGSRASLDRDGAGRMRCRWWPVCCRRTACGADDGWQPSCGGAWPLDHGEQKWGLLMGLIGEDGAPYWCSVLRRSIENVVHATKIFPFSPQINHHLVDEELMP
ncbi:hypothetical protein ACLOJK_029614, partial [Asimina triloba]